MADSPNLRRRESRSDAPSPSTLASFTAVPFDSAAFTNSDRVQSFAPLSAQQPQNLPSRKAPAEPPLTPVPRRSLTPTGSTRLGSPVSTQTSADTPVASRSPFTDNDGDNDRAVTPSFDGVWTPASTVTSPAGSPFPLMTGALPAPDSPCRRRQRPKTVARYDVADETPTDEPFYAPAFQQALTETTNVAAALAGALSGSTHGPDSLIKGLEQEAKRLARFELPARRMVGLVGDSGAGKSSLINSILDVANLATTGNGGGACTCVATEYHYHEDDSFMIDIAWFTAEELRTQVTQLLTEYRHYYDNRASIEKDRDEQTRIDLEKKAHDAGDTLQTMFSLANTSSLLSGTQAEVTQRLFARVEATAQDRGRLSTVIVPDAEGVTQSLLTLTSDSRNPGPDGLRWPFIKRVRVFLKAHILKTRVILVDLPGLRDTNALRSRLTEQYLLQCDEIFAVCNIGRVGTDEAVGRIFRLGTQAKLTNIGIICTMADVLHPLEERNEARKDKRPDIERRIDQFIREEKKAEAKITDLMRKLEEEEDDTEDADEATLRARDRLNRELRKAQKSKSEISLSLKSYIIRNRNDLVTQALRAKYTQDHPAGAGSLNVFCVSNKEYWDNRERPINIALPHLELSGIVALRRHCLSLVGRAQHAHAQSYIKDSVPGLIASTQLWVETGATSITDIQVKKRIHDVLDEVQSQLVEELTSRRLPIGRMIANLQEDMLDEMGRYRRQLTRHAGRWSAAAQAVHDEYTGWSSSSYAAFCRNYGSPGPYAQMYRDRSWNKEMFEAASSSIANLLDVSAEDGPGHRLQLLLSDMRNALQGAATRLESISNLLPATGTLLASVHSKQRLLFRQLQNAEAELQCKSSALQNDLRDGLRTSILGTLIEPAYTACNQEFGTGSHRRRADIMKANLRNQALFRAAFDAVYERFESIAGETSNKIESAAQDFLASMTQDVEMVRGENALQEAEKDVEFYTQVSDAIERARQELQRIQARLEST